MKKLVSLMVALVFLFSFALAGCGNAARIADLEQKIEELENNSGTHEEEFEEVYSITYGETTVSSSVRVNSGDFITITQEEYNLLPTVYSIYEGFNFFSLNNGHYLSKNERKVNVNVGDFVTHSLNKLEITSIVYNYVNIKFLSEKTCLIKNNSGTIKVISDYFKVVYFTD